ncbi:MAG: hypothetical protein ACKOHM_06290 [Spartobacteria bacterium]
MRTEFAADKLDYEMILIRILAKQGYKVYLNGEEFFSTTGHNNTPQYRPILLDANQRKKIKNGKNTLSVYTVVQFWEGLPPFRRDTREKMPRLGQMDVYFEGMDRASILSDAK